MDIREALAAEHSKPQTMRIVEFIGDDPAKFKELVKIFLTGEYRLAQRSAWAVNYCVQAHPAFIEPYLTKFLDQLTRADVHPAIRRNIVRLLQYVEIPDRLSGKVYSLCLDLVDNMDEPVAVRAFALTVATNIAKGEPDLQRELRLVVKKHMPHTTAAFHQRAKEILAL